jgi:hypothetical protein
MQLSLKDFCSGIIVTSDVSSSDGCLLASSLRPLSLPFKATYLNDGLVDGENTSLADVS